MKFILVSDDDREKEYAEQFPGMTRFVPFVAVDGYNSEMWLIEFESMEDFAKFLSFIFKKHYDIHIEPNYGKGEKDFWAKSFGAPYMVIEDAPPEAYEDGWL